MSSIGPKNPPGSPGRMDALLARLKAKSPGGEALTEETGASGAGAGDFQTGFQPGFPRGASSVLGTSQAILPSGPAGGPSQGAMSLRLATLTGQASPGGKSGLPVEGGSARAVDGPQGRTVKGDVRVSAPEDLALLKGAVLLEGSLDLAETALTEADLAPLLDLRCVRGDVALEGNRALGALDALAKLQQLDGNLYAGWNDGLTELSLPGLKALGGSLIVEGNPALTRLSLPALTEVGGYLHVHENEALTEALLAELSTLGAEVSVLENPSLVVIEMPALVSAPGGVEVAANGAELLQGLGATH